MKEIICAFNASEHGKMISSPSLCSPRGNNACRAKDAPNYAIGCCEKTARKLLALNVPPAFVTGVLRDIQNSEPDIDDLRLLFANELRVQGITSALVAAGITP